MLDTSNYKIRLPEERDVPGLFAYRSLAEIALYQCYDPMSLSAVKDFVETYGSSQFGIEGEWAQYVIEKKIDGKIVGDIAVFLTSIFENSAEIGITISPEYQRQGVGREALSGMIDWLFFSNNIQTIEAVTEIVNEGSVALLNSLGFIKTSRRVTHTWKNKSPDDFELFRLELVR